MLKILQARHQQYVNRELPDVQAGFRKGRVPHQLLEFTQTHVRQVGVAIQLSHPLLSPSPPAPNPFQHQSISNESTLRMR